MRLDYKILWFENQPTAVESAALSLKMDIADLGFNLVIEWIDDYNDIDNLIAEHAKNKNFDMIFMDWNLGISPEDGATLSHKLRINRIQTDIIFYSAKSSQELRKLMFDNNVDGVFCINRSNLADDSFEIIENKIQRILDINHIRGIVMETVGSLDHNLNELIEIVYSKSNDENKIKIIEKIKQLIQEQNDDACNKLTEMIKNISDINSLLQSYQFTSYLKFRCLVSIMKHKRKDPIFSDALNLLSNYDTNVLSPRNALAHAISQVNESGHFVLFTPTRIYDHNELCNVRKRLLEHRSNLQKLSNVLQSIETV
ncbi:hypothetical protein OHV31_14340 [Acinetobacter baumannii]|uniref:hypothetical protein n=1 Tax=Acinetobacter baumannii TaxID=470 RepID=UPI0023413E13|nr:hypothetical protein [Acinetobacter baumannii]